MWREVYEAVGDQAGGYTTNREDTLSDLIVAPTTITEVKPHPNADRLELAVVKGWQVVIAKGQFVPGDVALFVPPDAILPLELSDSWGVTQYLSKQRVKTVRLRGEMSFGFLAERPSDAELGVDLKDRLGIVKWEPPEPPVKAGESEREHGAFHKYTDIQNYRNFVGVLETGEEVIAVEKVHGTNSRIGLVSSREGGAMDMLVVGSHTQRKRMTGEGLYETPVVQRYASVLRLLRLWASKREAQSSVILHSEIYGKVQDLRYGLADGVTWAAFDLSVDGQYVGFDELDATCRLTGIPTCPVIYRGPFDEAKLDEWATGDTVIGDGACIREGIVIRPVEERTNPKLGRVILKRISDAYLLRKGGTEDH